MGWQGGEVQTNEAGGEGDETVEIGTCLGEQNMARNKFCSEDKESVRWLWSLLET